LKENIYAKIGESPQFKGHGVCDLNVAISRDHWTRSGSGAVTDFPDEIRLMACSRRMIRGPGHLALCEASAGHRQLPPCLTEDSLRFAIPRGDDSPGNGAKQITAETHVELNSRFLGFFMAETSAKLELAGLAGSKLLLTILETAGPPPDEGTIHFLARCLLG
jgi:hypothetical protein